VLLVFRRPGSSSVRRHRSGGVERRPTLARGVNWVLEMSAREWERRRARSLARARGKVSLLVHSLVLFSFPFLPDTKNPFFFFLFSIIFSTITHTKASGTPFRSGWDVSGGGGEDELSLSPFSLLFSSPPLFDHQNLFFSSSSFFLSSSFTWPRTARRASCASCRGSGSRTRGSG